MAPRSLSLPQRWLHALLLGLGGMAAAQAQPLTSPLWQHGLLQPPIALERPRATGSMVPVAMSPNINLAPEQLAIAARRRPLSAAAKLECSALDTRLPALERTAKRAPPEQKAEAEHTLSLARQRYAALRC